MSNIELDDFQTFVRDAQVKTQGKKRHLMVDIEMSTSGRRTNRRIYSPQGHKTGLRSWLHPYKKAVLLHHNDGRDAVGRLTNVVWESRDAEALKFLGGNYKALTEIKNAYESNDPMKIMDAMAKHNAFHPEWPGLGRLVGKAKIVDQDAIDKFLDERYLTWSVGQSTDAYYCMSCGAARHKGETCEHGMMSDTDEDGRPVTHLCGTMMGQELSIVNIPANDTSVTLKMELMDNASDGKPTPVIELLSDASVIVPTIILTEEKAMKLSDLQSLDMAALHDLLCLEDRVQEFTDALKADSQYEIGWLIRIHDSLHDMYDYRIKYNVDDALNRMPRAVFKLHGMIHDMSLDKGFRDSITNGELDHYSTAGAKDDKYLLKPLATTSDDKQNGLVLTDSQLSELVQAVLAHVTPPAPAATPDPEPAPVKEETDGQQEEKEEPETKEELLESATPEADPAPAPEADEDAPVDDASIDWALLDLALQAELANDGIKDAQLSPEKRKELPAGAFCGPDKSFPVHDCAHVTAARRLIGRAKLTADQKAKVLACVDRKAAKLKCDKDSSCKCGGSCKVDALKAKYDDLKQDLGQALKDLELTREKFIKTLTAYGKLAGAPDEVFDAKLDKLADWFDNHSQEQKGEIKTPLAQPSLKPTENPNGRTTDHKKSSDDELSEYEKGIVEKYKKLKTTDGKHRADRYLKDMFRYLPKNFDINSYVKSEE